MSNPQSSQSEPPNTTDAAAPVALVTGAARRVGRAIALELAQAGYNLAIHYRHSLGDAQELQKQLAALGRRTCLVPGDLANPTSPQTIVESVVAHLGHLDLLVNNAANFGKMSLANFDLIAWQNELQVNLTSAAQLCHHAAKHLAKAKPGRIINICDISADRPWSGHLAYCVSKAGVVCLTKALAKELAPAILVNAVSPGIAEFPEWYDQPTKDRLVANVPLRRAGRPQDVARTVRFLATQADYITGQIIAVDGGRSVR